MTNSSAMLSLTISLSTIAAAQLLLKARLALLGYEADLVPTVTATMQRAVSDPWFWCAGGLVLTSAITWYAAMLRLPLSLMLPLAALLAPMVSIGAWALLGEDLTPAKCAAITVIAAGTAWLGWLNS